MVMVMGQKLRIISLFLLCIVLAIPVFGFGDRNELCAYWASEGECLNNPRFMLINCHTSCMFLKDLDPNCEIYADQGRCHEDEDQLAILTQCAESCGFTYQWNHFARERIGIEKISDQEKLKSEKIMKKSTEETSQLNRNEIFREGAVNLFEATAAQLVGKSPQPILDVDSAPSEFSFVMGLGEALLAATRSCTKVLSEIIPESIGMHNLDEAVLVRNHVESVKIVDADLDLMISLGDLNMLQKNLWSLTQLLDPVITTIREVDLAKGNDEPEVDENITADPTGETERLLANGKKMPILGFGAAQKQGDDCVEAVKNALLQGYRHIETIEGFKNEAEVGKGIRMSEVPREEVFISTKITNSSDLGYEETKSLVESQLKKLGVTYIDLYLLDTPFSKEEDVQAKVDGTWKALGELLAEGVLQAIGVSNFGIEEIEDLKRRNPDSPAPMVLQNKHSIYHHGEVNRDGTDFLEYCRANDMEFIAHNSLTSWPYAMVPVEDAHVRHLAARLGKTPSQVLLRWQIQLGISTILESNDPEDIQVFDFALSDQDMGILSSLSWLVACDAHVATSKNVLKIEGFRHRSQHEEL